VTFTANVSGATAASYRWDFGDGKSLTTTDNSATHKFSTADDYTVTVTVTTTDGSSGSAQATVTVS
jgi:PKD repeat protein